MIKLNPIYKALILGSVIAVSTPSSADLNKELKLLFENNMTNTTAPQQHMGQTRGVFSGGGYTSRAKIMEERPISVSPPGFSASCSGIDAWGGSFSYINADQFVAFLRSVASNAIPYGFNLAMETICAPCENIMSDLRQAAAAMNSLQVNSCELGSGIMNLDLKQPYGQAEQAVKDTWSSLKNVASGVGDIFESSGKADGTAPSNKTHEVDPDTAQKTLQGNIVWRELVNHDVGSWFAGGKSETKFHEELMSLSGTVVIYPPEDKKDGSGDKVSDKKPFVKRLNAKDILYGNKPISDKNGNKATPKFRIYKCNTKDADGCLLPKDGSIDDITQEVEITGLEDYVLELLLYRSDSVYNRFTSGKGQSFNSSDVEMNSFMAVAQGGYIKYIRDLSSSPEAAKIFIQETAPVYAIQLLDQFVTQSMKAIETAVVTSNQLDMGEALKIIKTANMELRKEIESLYLEKGTTQDIVNLYHSLMKANDFKTYIPTFKGRTNI